MILPQTKLATTATKVIEVDMDLDNSKQFLIVLYPGKDITAKCFCFRSINKGQKTCHVNRDTYPVLQYSVLVTNINVHSNLVNMVICLLFKCIKGIEQIIKQPTIKELIYIHYSNLMKQDECSKNKSLYCHCKSTKSSIVPGLRS